MKSKVELNIAAPQSLVAELFSNPARNPEWMDDVEQIEAVSGRLGEVGSVYRVVPRQGGMRFTGTVLGRNLPDSVQLSLDEETVSVLVHAKFIHLSERVTKLISEEQFTFKGTFKKIFSIFARPAIKRAHRRHMESFKRFAEQESRKLRH